MRQVEMKKANIREPSFKRRNYLGGIKTRKLMLFWDQAYRLPVYWISDTRRRDGAIFIWALLRNCRNSHDQCQGRKLSRIPQGLAQKIDFAKADRSVVAMRAW
jgi:hypothetical protein